MLLSVLARATGARPGVGSFTPMTTWFVELIARSAKLEREGHFEIMKSILTAVGFSLVYISLYPILRGGFVIHHYLKGQHSNNRNGSYGRTRPPVSQPKAGALGRQQKWSPPSGVESHCQRLLAGYQSV